MKEIKVIISENKYGYKSIDLKVGNQTIYLTRSLSRLEINYLVNRSNRLVVGVKQEKYRDMVYNNLVIYEENGYENEYVVVKGIDLTLKNYLIDELLADRLDL